MTPLIACGTCIWRLVGNGNAQMNFTLKSLIRSAAISLITLAFAQAICSDRAYALTVVNPDFQIPVVGQAAGGVIQCPQTSAQIGWIFSCGSNGSSGVQLNKLFSAPNAPPPGQVAFIQNAGSISQLIDFKEFGTYTLTFYMAAATGNPVNAIEQLEITLVLGLEKLPLPPKPFFTKIVTPSTTSFSLVAIQLPIEGPISPGSYYLSFSNVHNAACTTCTNLIYGVSITAPPPIITKWPADVSPTSTVPVEGLNFGPSPGKIELSFSPQSQVKFSGGSKKELSLSVDKKDWVGTIGDGAKNTATSEKIIDASAIGAVPEQTVMISVRTADGRVSKGVKAKFHNDAVILKGPSIIKSSGSFNISGWDFGEAGTVDIHFTNDAFSSPSLDGHHDAKPKKLDWEQWVMTVTMPDVIGVAQQPVDITFTTKDGRKSNTWKAQFVPAMELVDLPWQNVIISCSNQGDVDLCQPGTITFSALCSLNQPGRGVPPDTIQAVHVGCQGDSDNGTDSYTAILTNGWVVAALDFDPEPPSPSNLTSIPDADNSTVWYDIRPPDIPFNAFPGPPPHYLPSGVVIINVSWHIGGDGGMAIYWADIYVTGPKAFRTNSDRMWRGRTSCSR
jgi:hypothetical protein